MNPVGNQSWNVYVLLSKKDGSWYIRSTMNMQKRMLTHNADKNRSTKHGIPWGLIYSEISLHKNDTRALETLQAKFPDSLREMGMIRGYEPLAV